MKTRLRSTAVYRSIKEGGMAQSTLLIFEDAVYLRALLKECAKAFFGAEEGSRVARLIDSESYLDCKILPPEGSKLTAETVSGLPAESMLRPAEGKNKLYVIASFESVTPLVQNKLLKLLEEPPAGVYFLLGASSAHGVLPTVLSRMSKYAVERFSAQEIAAALERNYAGNAGIRDAALASGGIYSAAETLLAEGGDIALAEAFLSGGRTAAICREIGDKKRTSFFGALRLVLRDMLFYKTGRENFCTFRKQGHKELAALYPVGAILFALEATAQAEREIKFNANAGQAAFNLALSLREERIKWKKLS